MNKRKTYEEIIKRTYLKYFEQTNDHEISKNITRGIIARTKIDTEILEDTIDSIDNKYTNKKIKF